MLKELQTGLEADMGKVIALGSIGVLLVSLAVYTVVFKSENSLKNTGLGLPGYTD
tara:strand:+ start:122 stop:286 length:165 start_codon:yes stop_codon:yes gene_type:complete